MGMVACDSTKRPMQETLIYCMHQKNIIFELRIIPWLLSDKLFMLSM